MGSEFQVNSSTTSAQTVPVLTAGAGESIVAVWLSDPGKDGLGGGVFAQRLAPRPFQDGFESGDICAWSMAVGSGGSCP
ncbi:MAG: hypothetical protein ABI689_07980 [Thermoanaerobaculia bacterium]